MPHYRGVGKLTGRRLPEGSGGSRKNSGRKSNRRKSKWYVSPLAQDGNSQGGWGGWKRHMGKPNFLLDFAGNLKLIKNFFVCLMVFVKGMRSPTLSDFAVLVWSVTKEQSRQSRGQKEKLFYSHRVGKSWPLR